MTDDITVVPNAGLGLQAVDDDVTAQAQLLRNIARRRTAHVEKDDLSKVTHRVCLDALVFLVSTWLHPVSLSL